MIYISVSLGNILYIILGIVIEVLLFNIIYSAMDADVEYLKKVLIYTIGMEIEQMILTKFIYTNFLLKERMNENGKNYRN